MVLWVFHDNTIPRCGFPTQVTSLPRHLLTWVDTSCYRNKTTEILLSYESYHFNFQGGRKELRVWIPLVPFTGNSPVSVYPQWKVDTFRMVSKPYIRDGKHAIYSNCDIFFLNSLSRELPQTSKILTSGQRWESKTTENFGEVNFKIQRSTSHWTLTSLVLRWQIGFLKFNLVSTWTFSSLPIST